jgi:glycosyltransferase involved in cell wall biosynthesis
MERAVIEIFDHLRPDVTPYIVQSEWVHDRDLPVIQELRRRKIPFSMLPDKKGWPRLGKPKSLKEFLGIVTSFLSGNFSLAKAMRGKDALYSASLYGAYFNYLAALYCRLTGKRVIHHFHDLHQSPRPLRIWSWFVTDFVHNTQFGYKTTAGTHPHIRRKHNVVIPCIVDAQVSSPRDPAVLETLHGRRNLFFVGQVSRHKGIDLLLEAFGLVASSHPEAMLHIVGDCPNNFREEFERLCGNCKVAGRVKYWGYRPDALCLLQSAYLYVHTSPPSRFNESFGRSVVEAMALGVPTACFRSGALQEIVVDRETGLICEESPAALADAIREMLDDEGLRNRCGEHAADRYRKLYSNDHVRMRWLEFFLGVPAVDQPCAAVTTSPASG